MRRLLRFAIVIVPAQQLQLSRDKVDLRTRFSHLPLGKLPRKEEKPM